MGKKVMAFQYSKSRFLRGFISSPTTIKKFVLFFTLFWGNNIRVTPALHMNEPAGGRCCDAGLGLLWHCYCIFMTFVCLIPKKMILILRGRGCVESKNMTSEKGKSTQSLNPSIIQVGSFKCRSAVPLYSLLCEKKPSTRRLKKGSDCKLRHGPPVSLWSLVHLHVILRQSTRHVLVSYRVVFLTVPPWIWLSPSPFIKSHTLTFFSNFTILLGLGPRKTHRSPMF